MNGYQPVREQPRDEVVCHGHSQSETEDSLNGAKDTENGMPAANAAPSRRPAALRRNSDFMLLWSGSGVSILGSQVSAFAYPLLVLFETGSPAKAGLTAFCTTLPGVVLQIPAGLLVDRCDRRILMIACGALRLVTAAIIVMSLLSGALSLVTIAVIAFIESSLSLTFRTAEQASVPNVVDSGQIPIAVSRNEGREQAAGLLGPPVSGFLLTLSRLSPFAFSAFAQLVSLTALTFIRRKLQVPRETWHGHPIREMMSGVRWIWGRPFLRLALVLIAVSNGLFEIMTLATMVMLRSDHQSQAVIGAVAAAAGVGGVAGAFTASRFGERLGLASTVIASNCSWAVLAPLMALVHESLLIAVIYATISFVGSVWTVAVIGYALQQVPQNIQGRVVSVGMLTANGMIPLGSLLGGIALNELPTRTVLLIVSAIMAVLAITAAMSPSVRAMKART